MYKLEGFIDRQPKYHDAFLSPLFLKNGKSYFKNANGFYEEADLLKLIVEEENMFFLATKKQIEYSAKNEKIYAFKHGKEVVSYNQEDMVDYLNSIYDELEEDAIKNEVENFLTEYDNSLNMTIGR